MFFNGQMMPSNTSSRPSLPWIGAANTQQQPLLPTSVTFPASNVYVQDWYSGNQIQTSTVHTPAGNLQFGSQSNIWTGQQSGGFNFNPQMAMQNQLLLSGAGMMNGTMQPSGITPSFGGPTGFPSFGGANQVPFMTGQPPTTLVPPIQPSNPWGGGGFNQANPWGGVSPANNGFMMVPYISISY
jgi:hypothetical protein